MRFGFSGLLIHWVLKIWIQKVFLALPVGIAIGLISKKLLKYSQYHDLIDKQSFLVFSLALSVHTHTYTHTYTYIYITCLFFYVNFSSLLWL